MYLTLALEIHRNSSQVLQFCKIALYLFSISGEVRITVKLASLYLKKVVALVFFLKCYPSHPNVPDNSLLPQLMITAYIVPTAKHTGVWR